MDTHELIRQKARVTRAEEIGDRVVRLNDFLRNLAAANRLVISSDAGEIYNSRPTFGRDAEGDASKLFCEGIRPHVEFPIKLEIARLEAELAAL